MSATDETVAVNKDDLVNMKQGLEQIIKLSREEMSMAGTRHATIRPREIGIAAALMQKMVDHYLKDAP